ncbi:MAG: right-handed parallel beta-helix repeat-containing protein [Planctomycetes bacterium]|nr:right-handed parallel beta-helix repeat-containing protein [Planctomycetota bacterium]
MIPLCLVSIMAGAWVANAGDLNPPAGPVAPTHKTLTEIEPRTAVNAINTPGDANSLFKITQPGSYYLTGNISGVVGKHGIEIVASGVTLDLNGFDLLGVVGSLDGVSATVANLHSIAVVNGSVRNWGDEGVDLGSLLAANCRVADLHVSGSLDLSGISVGNGSTVTNCVAYDNAVDGISAEFGCTITNCCAYRNGETGIIVHNTGNTVTNCSAFDNNIEGIHAGRGCTITNCSVSWNGSGINTGEGSMVLNCSAIENTAVGIYARNSSTVADCAAQANTLDGILCTSFCILRGNTAAGNGLGAGNGAGIHATGSDNRIEGNNCTGADRGIDVDFTGNIIIKNTCSGNTSNWEIAIGNSVGPIVVAGTNAAVISGNGPSPSTLGSTDPNANFSY